MSKKEPKQQIRKPKKDKAAAVDPNAPKAEKPKGPSEPSRLRVRYGKEIIPALMKHFQYTNIMAVPKLEKLLSTWASEKRLPTPRSWMSPWMNLGESQGSAL